MGITAGAFHEGKTLLGRPNFFFVPNERAVGKPTYTHSHIYAALDELTNARPNWRFVAVDVSRYTNFDVITSVAVHEDSELLGVVEITWKGRGYKIKVDNERITAKRERGNGYHTDSPAKAALAIRKNFFKAADDERLHKSMERAVSVIGTEMHSKLSERQATANATFDKAVGFAKLHIEEYLNHSNKHKQHDAYKTAVEQYEVVKSVKEALDKGGTILVVLDGTRYIVKDKGDVTSLTDDTLPYELRGKLGLLKLVQDKQMVSNVGCRVDESTFVLLREEQKS